MSTYEDWAELSLPIPDCADDIPAVSVGSDGDVRVTIRLSRVERAEILDFMRRHNMDNISEFVRLAIRWAIAGGMA